MICADVCNPARARSVGRRSVQVATPARGETPYAIANALEVDRHTVARRNSREALWVFLLRSFYEPIARLQD